jgi:putative transposase
MFIDAPAWRCGDNASTESLRGSLKVTRPHGQQLAMRRASLDEIVDWFGSCGTRRTHSTLDYVSPVTCEKNWVTGGGRAA